LSLFRLNFIQFIARGIAAKFTETAPRVGRFRDGT
jgi:hypothetical protein